MGRISDCSFSFKDDDSSLTALLTSRTYARAGGSALVGLSTVLSVVRQSHPALGLLCTPGPEGLASREGVLLTSHLRKNQLGKKTPLWAHYG